MSNYKVTLQPATTEYSVQVKPNKTAVTSVQITNTPPQTRFADLVDVDTTDQDNGEVLVYDSTSQTYVMKTIPVIRGGEF